MRCRGEARWVTKSSNAKTRRQFLGRQTKARAIQAGVGPAALVGSPSGKAERETGKNRAGFCAISSAAE